LACVPDATQSDRSRLSQQAHLLIESPERQVGKFRVKSFGGLGQAARSVRQK